MPFLLSSPWPGLILWSLLFVSDSVLTVACARLYQQGVREQMVFEGSYEITPFHQRDVDALRALSPRFLILLGLTDVGLWLVWVWVSNEGGAPRQLFAFALGSFISTQLVVHVRHLRNLFLFRAIARGDVVRGRIEYPRSLMLRLSSIEILSFSAFFVVLFAFTESVFILGGSFACLVLGAQHWRLARKQLAMQKAASAPSTS